MCQPMAMAVELHRLLALEAERPKGLRAHRPELCRFYQI